VSAPFLNLSAYRFVALPDAVALRDVLHERAQALGLKGTVLLAEEGINQCVAGTPEAIDAWRAVLDADARLAGLDAKLSASTHLPFRRLKVKVKREIIRMNQPQVRPADGRAPALDAATLARWLDTGRDDAGRPVVVLDTRNGFEVDHGAFERTLDWRLERFSDFPTALAAHRDTLADRTVVTCCTGGIRCEKAALALREAGLEHVWQLDGGILRYLEQIGSRHWRGRCFVFDERGSLGADLT
jgi:UPF0176 protein